MTQQFQLSPPPDALRTPLVQLKDHYVQQVIEYEKKLAQALEKLAHVEALLEGWSSVEELPNTKELPQQNPLSPSPAAFSAAIAENVESDEGDVVEKDSSLTSSNGNASGAVNESAVKTHQGNGAKSHTSCEQEAGGKGTHLSRGLALSPLPFGEHPPAPQTPAPLPLLEEPFFPELLERFKDTLDTSTRTLLGFCVDSGGIEVTDTSIGGKTLSLECPNDVVFRRLKLKLPRLVFKWNQSVGNSSIVVVSMAKNPLDSKVLSWSQEDLAQLKLVVDKVFEVNGVAYTQLTNNDRSWLVIVPQSVLTPLSCEEKQSLKPPSPSATTNTLGHGSRNGSTSSNGVQDVEMLPNYQGMNRLDALSLLLAEHSGTVLHLDFIVRSLYGELETELFKAIKKRVGSSLTQGVEQKLWARVADEPGCYTKDLSLVEPAEPPPAFPSGSGGLSRRKTKSSFVKLPSLMLPPYRGQSLKVALASLLESHPGKIYCIDDFIALLFGSVEPSQKGRVRDAVIKGLSEGKREGRFESIPGSLGCFTLDYSLLEAQSKGSQP